MLAAGEGVGSSTRDVLWRDFRPGLELQKIETSKETVALTNLLHDER
jgi:hypothetical protein